jgi:hypothetical protein
MANYIKHLQGIQRDAHFLGDQAQTELDDLVNYLLSSKFHTDPTVQVKDVLRRLEPVRSALTDLLYVTHPNNMAGTSR